MINTFSPSLAGVHRWQLESHIFFILGNSGPSSPSAQVQVEHTDNLGFSAKIRLRALGQKKSLQKILYPHTQRDFERPFGCLILNLCHIPFKGSLFKPSVSVSVGYRTQTYNVLPVRYPPPPLMHSRFLASSIYGSCTNFPYRGGNEQSWADVTLAHFAGTGAFLPNLFPPHTPLRSPHLSPFDLSNDPNESASVFFEAQRQNLYLLYHKIQ